jgi:hypothetical protein
MIVAPLHCLSYSIVHEPSSCKSSLSLSRFLCMVSHSVHLRDLSCCSYACSLLLYLCNVSLIILLHDPLAYCSSHGLSYSTSAWSLYGGLSYCISALSMFFFLCSLLRYHYMVYLTVPLHGRSYFTSAQSLTVLLRGVSYCTSAWCLLMYLCMVCQPNSAFSGSDYPGLPIKIWLRDRGIPPQPPTQ